MEDLNDEEIKGIKTPEKKRADNMRKKQRNNITVQLVNMILVCIGLALVFSMHLHFYYLFAVLVISIIISTSIRRLLLIEDKKKRSASQTKKKFSPILFNSHSYTKPLEQLLTYDVKDLSEDDFKELCFHYFKNTYRQIERTPIEKDDDVDFIVVNRDKLRVAVEIRHKMASGEYVTSDEIHALIAAKKTYNCRYAMFISSTDYTQDARDTAAEHKIELYAYQWVENKILRWRENRIS